MKPPYSIRWVSLLIAGVIACGGTASGADQPKTGSEVTTLAAHEDDDLFARIGNSCKLKFKVRKAGLTDDTVPCRISVWVADINGNDLILRELDYVNEVTVEPQQDVNAVKDPVTGKYPPVQFAITVKNTDLVGTSVFVQVRRVGASVSAQRGYIAIPVLKANGNPGTFAPDEGEKEPKAPVRTPIGVGRR